MRPVRAPRPLRLLLALLLGTPLLVAPAGAAVTPPPAGAPFDYQLGGAYPPDPGVTVVVRDRTVAPAPGAYGVCYLNAFQTQPGALDWWRRRHGSLLLRRHGRLVADPDWPDEVLLDASTAPRRRAIARIVGRWLDGCARAGYRGAELDNLDSWTRSRGRLRRADAVALARLLVARGHRAGLAVAQKNAAELAAGARARIGFDFAVVEECERYRECDAYAREYGDRLLEVEYGDAGGLPVLRRACAARGGRVSIVLRDRDLVARGRPGHLRRTC
nr:endo alpha-1,4 polygalactosaminidase [Patulibacter sp. SYSU D01012]